jgi:hypothetical protein
MSPQALRIVLFGMAHAGKSSLLGALAQAAQSQEKLLNGRLTDLSGGLAELQQRLYDGSPRETLEEVVPYLAAFEPGESQRFPNGAIEVVFVDCDGRAANKLLAQRDSLDGHHCRAGLAYEILHADSLMLVMDASAPLARVDADFAEFAKFLQLLEKNRGRRSGIGGLPVFLVLTKCDLLAESGDTPAAWSARIDERMNRLGEHFRDFLRCREKASPVPFGSIECHLRATAVKRPALAGSPPQPRERFGVAELFRQSLVSARVFRLRCERSGQRLFWTVTLTSLCMITLITLTVILLFDRLESIRPALTGRSRLQESEIYKEYYDKLLLIHLADLQTDTDLSRADDLLNKDLHLADGFDTEWSQSTAARLRGQLLKDLEALRSALAATEKWFRDSISLAEKLRTFAEGKPADDPAWEHWHQQVQTSVNLAFPHSAQEFIPGSTSLTYEVVLSFDRIIQAMKDWAVVQGKLGRLQDVVAALGLAGKSVEGMRPPLDIPEKCSLASVKSHFQLLSRRFPDFQKQFVPGEVPDAIKTEVRQKAEAGYNHLLESGRGIVLAQLQQRSSSGSESPDLWKNLADWLVDPIELREWRALAQILGRFMNPEVTDPVIQLADFVAKDVFQLDIQKLILEIPMEQKCRPIGTIVIFHASAHSEAKPVLFLKVRNEDGERDTKRLLTSYTFVRDTATVLSFHPGDPFFAHVRLKKDEDSTDWMLTWARSRSEVFSFECLVRPPRMHRADQTNTEGELVDSVRLIVKPDTGLPRVPDLLPVVKLNQK